MMKRVGLLFAMVTTFGLAGAASANWHQGTREDAQRRARFNYDQRVSRCHSQHCRDRAERDYHRDVVRIDRGRF